MDKKTAAAIAFALATGGLLLYAESKQGFRKEGYLQVGYYVPVTVLFTINIRGGKPPYTVTMDYGDGTSETFTTSETTVTKTKTYSAPGNYVPKVTVTDAVKQTASASADTLSAISPETITKLAVSLTWSLQTQGSSFVIR
jgi:PKD repeat protein